MSPIAFESLQILIIDGKRTNARLLRELLAVVGMANETNRLANGYQVETDERIAKAAKQR